MHWPGRRAPPDAIRWRVRTSEQEAKAWPWPTKEFPRVRSSGSVPEIRPMPIDAATLFPAKGHRISGCAPPAPASHRLPPILVLSNGTNPFDDPDVSPHSASRPNGPARPSLPTTYDALPGTSIRTIALHQRPIGVPFAIFATKATLQIHAAMLRFQETKSRGLVVTT